MELLPAVGVIDSQLGRKPKLGGRYAYADISLISYIHIMSLIFYVLFWREPQLLDASSDRSDSGGAGKLSKSLTKDDRGIFGGTRGIFGGPCYSEPVDITFRPRVCPDILCTFFA